MKRPIDHQVHPADSIKRMCVETMAGVKRPREPDLESRKRQRALAPEHEARWAAYAAGKHAGRQEAIAELEAQVIPDIDRVIRAAVLEMSNYYDSLFNSLCSGNERLSYVH
jgi:hypothetical protein